MEIWNYFKRSSPSDAAETVEVDDVQPEIDEITQMARFGRPSVEGDEREIGNWRAWNEDVETEEAGEHILSDNIAALDHCFSETKDNCNRYLEERSHLNWTSEIRPCHPTGVPYKDRAIDAGEPQEPRISQAVSILIPPETAEFLSCGKVHCRRPRPYSFGSIRPRLVSLPRQLKIGE